MHLKKKSMLFTLLSTLRKITILLIAGLSFCTQTVIAQERTSSLRGQIVDETKEGVELASVALLQLPDSNVVQGVQTSANGRFQIDKIAAGNYALRISYVGYTDQVVNNVQLQNNDTNNLGVITLSQDTRLLDEVVVERSAPAVEYQLDRTVFNVTPDIQAMSVNATEILEQIPMVELDEEGSPSVMGQNVTILIDGRPSRIYGDNIETVLKLIPSGVIEKVEVITSPSARYTTEQGGIVLNIVTKTDKLVGISGIASISSTTNNNYSPSLNVNVTRNKFGFNNSISFDFDKDLSSSTVLRKNLLDNAFFTDQSRKGTDNDKDFSYNGNLFYQPNKKSTVGIFFGLGKDTENENETLITRSLGTDDQLLSSYVRSISGDASTWQYRGGLDYKQTFADEDQVLEFKAFYSTRDDKDDQIFDQVSDWEELDYLQHQFSSSQDKGFTIQTDYVQPFGEKSNLEAGFRADWETDQNEFIPKEFDDGLGQYIIDSTLINDFISNEREFSLYAMYRTSIERFSLQAGARLEKSTLDVDQHILNQSYNNDFLNLIPTANLAYRLKNEDNIKFSYSRRANRPRWRQLNPFVDYSNPENIQSGNPDLKPEFTNSFEFSYGKFINQFNLFGSVFYRHSNDPIQRISTIDSTGVSFTTFQNIGTENYYGLETGAGADILANWNVRLNIGIRKSEVLGFAQQNSTTSFTGRFSTFYPLPLGFRGYAFVRYSGPRAIAQGTMKGMLISDLGVRKSFFDKKANLSLRVSDLFNSRQYARTLEQTNFIETSNYRRQSRFVSLSIRYIFGQLKANERNNGEPEPPTPMDGPEDNDR